MKRVLLIAILLAGCGGGGGKASAPPATTSAPDIKPASTQCQALTDLGAKVAQAFAGSADTDTTEPRRLLNELSHTADEQIRPDIAVIAGAYTKIVGAMEDVNAGTTDPETVARLQKVLAGIDTDAVGKANANITAWVQQHC
jgi:hypothetical protein